MNLLPKTSTLLLFFLSFMTVTSGQLLLESSTPYMKAENTAVPADSIYLVNQVAGLTVRTSLQGSYIYEWLGFNNNSDSWDIPLAYGTINTYTPSIEGGILLNIRDINSDQIISSYRCWIFVPQILGASVSIEESTCQYLTFVGTAQTRNLVYYDLDGNSHIVVYPLTYSISSSQGIEGESKDEFVSIEAPFSDDEYTLTVALPALGKSASSEPVAHTAFAVRAMIGHEVIKPEVPNEGHMGIVSGSAPLEIRFTDNSKGVVTNREWRLGSISSREKDPFHVFTTAGRDTVRLFVENFETGCMDEAELEILIMDLALEAPNAFTPNGDGVNDQFRVYYRSVRKFKMQIVSRWGRTVYESDNPAEGWDGSIGNGDAPPGVYYYFVEAEGYNPGEKIKLQGPVHLIREK